MIAEIVSNGMLSLPNAMAVVGVFHPAILATSYQVIHTFH